jgi:hypothetical protein
VVKRPAVMLAIMEPPPGIEEEFNDWYDTEHLPQRQSLPGFLSASRWISCTGFPRSLAVYDLRSLSVLKDPAYLAVAGAQSTPWSRRVLARTARAGRIRVEAERITRGDSLFLPQHTVNSLLVARYGKADPAFAHAALAAFSAVPRLAQIRLFSATAAGEIWALAEFSGPVGYEALANAIGELDGVGASFFNLYAPYSPSAG